MCEDAFMRTTVELADDLFEQAKIAAVERKTTLRALIGTALAKELGVVPMAARATQRLSFPIFSSARPGTLQLSGRKIALEEAERELERLGLPR